MMYYVILMSAVSLALVICAVVALQRRNLNRQRQAALFDSAMRSRFDRKGDL